MRVVAAVTFWLVVGATGAGAEVLLRDDFDAAPLDATRWFQPVGCGTYIPRTQMRPPSHPLALRDGALALELDTFNPTGLSLFGSEIVSHATFSPESDGAVQVRARVRLREPTSAGLDAALFLYRIVPPATACDATPPRDEIDFELLTNQLDTGTVLTNVYDAEPIGGPGSPAYPVLAGLDPRAWTHLDLRWWRDRIEWRVNGVLLRTETAGVPDGPMALRINFWAPDADFPEAYASPPAPVASPGANAEWIYEIDFVEVRTLPEPGALTTLAAVAPLALMRRRARAAARRGSGRSSPRSPGPTPARVRPPGP